MSEGPPKGASPDDRELLREAGIDPTSLLEAKTLEESPDVQTKLARYRQLHRAYVRDHILTRDRGHAMDTIVADEIDQMVAAGVPRDTIDENEVYKRIDESFWKEYNDLGNDLTRSLSQNRLNDLVQLDYNETEAWRKEAEQEQ